MILPTVRHMELHVQTLVIVLILAAGMWNSMFSPMIMARIWANILTRVKELGVKGEPTKDQWARAKEPYRRFLGFGVSGFVKQVGTKFCLSDFLATSQGRSRWYGTALIGRTANWLKC